MSTDSYRKCAKCGATPIQDGAVSFHRFPKPGKTNIKRARAWAMFCWPEKDWTSVDALTKLFKSNKVLCKRHFKGNCFTDSTNKQLGRFSVPTECSDTESKVTFETISQPSLSPELPSELPSKLPSQTKGILKDIDIKKLNQLTSQEKKLYKICSRRLNEINRLGKYLKYKKKSLILEKLCEYENVKKITDMKLSNSFIIFLQSQLQNCKKKQKARYNLDQKIMALTLYKKSPGCYRLLRRMFALPCQSTLNKLLDRVPLKTGIDSQVFERLKDMAQAQIKEENLCSLLFDQMPIKKHLYYNEKIDMIEGFQDHGNDKRTNEIACNALVFMLTGVRKKWKQPIAFYFSGRSVTSDRLSVIIKEILHECWKTGLIVVSTVCNLSRVNIKALDILGSTKDKPYFVHEGHEVVTILDPPHLIKCTRNMFLKHDIECSIANISTNCEATRGVAKWSHLQKFFEVDKNNSNNFVFAPALTEQHLNPNSKQKLQVKLAVQVFSHKVTVGMLTRIATNDLPAGAYATASLLNQFDQLFDALNADSADLRDGKKYSKNMSKQSPHLNLFRTMKKFISEMNFIGLNSSPLSQAGWIRTINAVERLWRNLQHFGVKTLSTRRLNKDPLENCFACIRYYSGSNNNPNLGQFIAGAKTAIINNLYHSGSKRNCVDDEAILSDNFRNIILPSEKKSEDIYSGSIASDAYGDTDSTVDLDPLIIDATEAIEQASADAQTCAYICGCILKTNNTSDKCLACKTIFLAWEPIDDNINLFSDFRYYNEIHERINYVNTNFVHCVEVCSSVVNRILKTAGWKKGLKDNIMSSLSQVDFDFLFDCPQHFTENKNHIMILSFHICVKRYTVLKNRMLAEDGRKNLSKRKCEYLVTNKKNHQSV